MTADLSAVPDIDVIRSRRASRWDVVHRDPASWAHLAAEADRLLTDYPDVYTGADADALRALAWAARRISGWGGRQEGPSRRPRRPGPIKHGTYQGYWAHLRQGVPFTDGDECGCVAAGRAYREQLKKGKGVGGPRRGLAGGVGSDREGETQ